MTRDEAQMLAEALAQALRPKMAWTVEEAAAELGCTVNFLRNGLHERGFPHLEMGNRVLFSRENLEDIQRLCDAQLSGSPAKRRARRRLAAPVDENGQVIRLVGARAERHRLKKTA